MLAPFPEASRARRCAFFFILFSDFFFPTQEHSAGRVCNPIHLSIDVFKPSIHTPFTTTTKNTNNHPTKHSRRPRSIHARVRSSLPRPTPPSTQ